MNWMVNDVIKVLETYASGALQESYDNSGLQVGRQEMKVSGVMITLDVTEQVLDEAIAKGCNMVISHHPLIFGGLKRLTGHGYVERLVMRAVKEDIAVYSIHTNLDNVYNGVSGILAQKIGLINEQVLAPRHGDLRKLVVFVPLSHVDEVRDAMLTAGAGHIGRYDGCSYTGSGTGTFRAGEGSNPFVGEVGAMHQEQESRVEVVVPKWAMSRVIAEMKKVHPYEEVAWDEYKLENSWGNVGSGIVGDLPEPEMMEAFLLRVKELTGTGVIRHSMLTHKMVRRVALCGGSGSFLTHRAIAANADVYLTGDLKYHDYFEADSRVVLADIGHYESEQFTKELILNLLKEKFSTFALLISSVNSNSVHYL